MTASTKDLIERARSATIDWDGKTQLGDSEPPMDSLRAGDVRQLADALERLTQPGGEVEPVCFAHQGEIDYVKAGGHTGAFYLENPDSDPEFVALYSAATVARLIAERDAQQREWSKAYDIGVAAIHERDALQEQVKMLREAIIKHKNFVMMTGTACKGDAALHSVLAATDPKEKP